MTRPKYSICITNYNKGERVRTLVESLLPQTDEGFEVVISDNLSNDGSGEILREYAKNGMIRLIQAKCSRGMGRQIAFENARGEYIVSGIDTDDFIIPNRLRPLLEFYHKRCEGNMLRVQWSGIAVSPTELIKKVGGWRDLDWSDNWDICERAARIRKYVWTIFKVKDIIRRDGFAKVRGVHPSLEESDSVIARNKMRYRKYVDELRLRKRPRPFGDGQKFAFGKSIDYALALISSPYFGHLNPPGINFDEFAPEYFVDSSEWWHRVGQDEEQEIRMYSRLLKMTPVWYSRNSA
jgi:glycosyltransferase involved in cell wall biosynthesis